MTNKYKNYKDEIFVQFARIGKAVSSPKRLELLELLSQGPQTVEVLADKAGLGIANTSRHLAILSSARLIEGTKDGRFVIYSIADDAVYEYIRSLRSLAEKRLAEVREITRQFIDERDAMEPIDRMALLKRVRKGLVTVLDVRPGDEYTAGHIPGAISIPLNELKARLSELPRDREIVAYCRGPYCLLAVRAVEMLRKSGFSAMRLEDGVRDWSEQGLPVDTGN